MNKLESLQKETNGIIFIKSYPMLNCFTSSEKQFIELVLSYQENDKQFKMKYESISKLLTIRIQSVKDIVCKFKKSGIMITDHKSNYNGTSGGSHTSLAVDIDNLISCIKNKISGAEVTTKGPTQSESVQVPPNEGHFQSEKKARVEIIPYIESASMKYKRKTKNYQNRIDELKEIINDLKIKYVDELDQEYKSYFNLEIEEDGFYSRVYLFEKDVA
jgi:hypothetical protein